MTQTNPTTHEDEPLYASRAAIAKAQLSQYDYAHAWHNLRRVGQ